MSFQSLFGTRTATILGGSFWLQKNLCSCSDCVGYIGLGEIRIQNFYTLYVLPVIFILDCSMHVHVMLNFGLLTYHGCTTSALSLGTLVSRQKCVSYQDYLEEWSTFRQFLAHNARLAKHSDVINDLCTSPTTSALFRNMSILSKIFRVIPVHTADVERTFSQLKLIKTRTRNRMNEKTLDSLLQIAIEGPPLECFPIGEAVALWHPRRTEGSLLILIIKLCLVVICLLYINYFSFINLTLIE